MATRNSSPPPYVGDIRAQPATLQLVLDAGLPGDGLEVLSRLDDFDRIVLTGMGSSLQALYPTYLRLAAAGLPVWFEDTAELLGYQHGLLTPRTLLWITSQSGESAEVVELLSRLARPGVSPGPPTVLGVTNDLHSTLATTSSVVIPLHSGDEQTVGTRSYMNTLALCALATAAALNEAPDSELLDAPSVLAADLDEWDTQRHAIDDAVPDEPTFVLGRGASLASARTGALIMKEAARRPLEGMSVPQFRHGPLEMAGPAVTVLLLAGDRADIVHNEKMRTDLRATGARCVWVDTEPQEGPAILMPRVVGRCARSLAEILPLQLLTVALAARTGDEPGRFRQIGKITRTL